MIGKKRKPAETRRDMVRRKFREHALRLTPSPFVQMFDGRGRPRERRTRQTEVKA